MIPSKGSLSRENKGSLLEWETGALIGMAVLTVIAVLINKNTLEGGCLIERGSLLEGGC